MTTRSSSCMKIHFPNQKFPKKTACSLNREQDALDYTLTQASFTTSQTSGTCQSPGKTQFIWSASHRHFRGVRTYQAVRRESKPHIIPPQRRPYLFWRLFSSFTSSNSQNLTHLSAPPVTKPRYRIIRLKLKANLVTSKKEIYLHPTKDIPPISSLFVSEEDTNGFRLLCKDFLLLTAWSSSHTS